MRSEPAKGELGHPRVHLRRIRSTNDHARRLAAAGAPHGTLVTAGEQSAGRGRQGRSWSAPADRALLLSLVIRPPDALLPLRAGLAVADLVGPSAQLKWPNDVLLGGRKIAGVLAEARPQEGWAVLGIGVNVAVELEDLPLELRDTAGSLGRPASQLPTALEELLTTLQFRLSEPAEATTDAFGDRDALLGRPVSWRDGTGTGAGIDERGALRVRTADGTLVTLEAGEVHLVGGPLSKAPTNARPT